MVNPTAAGLALTQVDEARVLRRVGLGIALSLLAHALLIPALRAPAPAPASSTPRPLAVRVQPPPPPRPEKPQPAATPRASSAGSPPRAARATPPRRVIAVPAEDSAPVSDPFVVQQPPADTDTPRFDPEAARRMARSLANMKDPAREGTAVGQFPDKPLETESRAARAIGAAKRRNCKDGLPGGLLGPILILADKKDSGCKW